MSCVVRPPGAVSVPAVCRGTAGGNSTGPVSEGETSASSGAGVAAAGEARRGSSGLFPSPAERQSR